METKLIIPEAITEEPPPALDTPERTYFITASALKAYEDGRIGGYLVVWGSPAQKDKQGEYFTPETDFKLNWYDKRPVLFHHGLTSELGAEEIGVIITTKTDERGIYAEAVLDINHEDPTKRMYARKAYEMVKAGKLGWSSGSVPHLVKVDADGRIRQWAITEGSLTPTPAEPKRTTVQALKAMVNAALDSTPVEAIEHPAKEPEAPRAEPAFYKSTKPLFTRGLKTMDMNALIGALEENGASADMILGVLKKMGSAAPVEGVAADPATVPTPDETKMTAEEDLPLTGKAAAKLISEEIKKAMKTAPATDELPGVDRPQPKPEGVKTAPSISVISPYQRLNAHEMAFLADLRYRNGKGKRELPVEFHKELADKAIKAANDGKLFLDEKAREWAVKSVDMNNTSEADYGGDWVPTLWSSDLWEKERIENRIASSIQSFEMPSDSYEYPIEWDDPIVYAVAPTDDTSAHMSALTGSPFTISRMKTDKVTFNAAKMGLQVPFNMEIDEDSIIPFIPQLRNQALRAMQDAIDNVVINADATTGTGNINYKGANTSAAATSKFLYGGGDGFRHVPLIDAPTQVVNASGGKPTLALLRQLRGKLARQYYSKVSEQAWFVDPETWLVLQNLDELVVWQTNGRGSTVNTGLTPYIDNIEVIPTEELALTDSTGYAMADGSGTLGQIVLVHRPSWKLGYRRQITSDVSYIPYRDAYIMTMTLRMALGRRDTASVALMYNILVS
jgi:HK97 family phage major capsid protein